MNYTKKGDKFIFKKDGVYFSMTRKQVVEMTALCMGILLETENDPFGLGDTEQLENYETTNGER